MGVGRGEEGWSGRRGCWGKERGMVERVIWDQREAEAAKRKDAKRPAELARAHS